MKFLIAFACILAGINAMPEVENAVDSRITINAILNAIENVSQQIKDAGMDPLIIKSESAEYALPVPVLFNAAAFVEDVLSTGLSDIRVHRMNLGLLTMRLDFDLELPLIHFSVGDAQGHVTVFGETIEGEASGSVDIISIRVVGRAQISLGIISGISVSSLTINFTLRGIDSNLKIVIHSYDLSDFVNTFLGVTIPETLLEFRAEINTLLELILLPLINDNL